METRSSLWLILLTYPLPPIFFYEGYGGISNRIGTVVVVRCGEDNDNSHPLERAKWLGLRVVVDAPRKEVTTTPVRLSWEKNRAMNIHPEARAMDVPLFLS